MSEDPDRHGESGNDGGSGGGTSNVARVLLTPQQLESANDSLRAAWRNQDLYIDHLESLNKQLEDKVKAACLPDQNQSIWSRLQMERRHLRNADGVHPLNWLCPHCAFFCSSRACIIAQSTVNVRHAMTRVEIVVLAMTLFFQRGWILTHSIIEYAKQNLNKKKVTKIEDEIA